MIGVSNTQQIRMKVAICIGLCITPAWSEVRAAGYMGVGVKKNESMLIDCLSLNIFPVAPSLSCNKNEKYNSSKRNNVCPNNIIFCFLDEIRLRFMNTISNKLKIRPT